jgi:hypothetical protein
MTLVDLVAHMEGIRNRRTICIGKVDEKTLYKIKM